MDAKNVGIADNTQNADREYKMFVGSDLHDRMMELIENELKLKQNEITMSNKIKLEVEFTNKSSVYGHNRIYRIKDEGGSTCFRLESIAYPECCGITIFKNASIKDVDFKTFGEYLDLIINDLKANDKYAKILFYTTQDARLAKLMATYPGCITLDKFKNVRSGNMLVGFEINLFDDNYEDEEDEDEEEIGDADLSDIMEDDEDEVLPPYLARTAASPIIHTRMNPFEEPQQGWIASSASTAQPLQYQPFAIKYDQNA